MLIDTELRTNTTPAEHAGLHAGRLTVGDRLLRLAAVAVLVGVGGSVNAEAVDVRIETVALQSLFPSGLRLQRAPIWEPSAMFAYYLEQGKLFQVSPSLHVRQVEEAHWHPDNSGYIPDHSIQCLQPDRTTLMGNLNYSNKDCRIYPHNRECLPPS